SSAAAKVPNGRTSGDGPVSRTVSLLHSRSSHFVCSSVSQSNSTLDRTDPGHHAPPDTCRQHFHGQPVLSSISSTVHWSRHMKRGYLLTLVFAVALAIAPLVGAPPQAPKPPCAASLAACPDVGCGLKFD